MAEQHNTNQQPERKPARKKRKGGAGVVIKRILMVILTLLLIFSFTGAFLACFSAVYIKNVIIPQADLDVTDYPMNLSSTIYYTDPETGEVSEYESLHGDQNRVWMAYADIPQNLIHAAVAIEDRRFYEHNGVDWLSTGKSIVTMFTGGNIRGGSTITQQLIKNLTTYDDITVKRKVLEIFRALEFDKKYSKEQTLEWYLNYIYFGRKCYGVYTASYKYFGKDVSQLSLAECASLISITNNPSLYDPYTNPENNAVRRGYVLDAMLRDGYISEEECAAAKAEVIDFHSAEPGGQSTTVYSWYTEQVITDVMNDLMETYGYSETVAHDLVYSGGLEIYACVDIKVQQAIDEVYSDVANLPYTSARGQQLQSAIVIIDHQGNVVGLAGKMGEKTPEDTRGWNRATRTLRQAGSSMKPISVYAPAIEMGLITPYTIVEDSPAMLIDENTPWPSNVDYRYRGLMTIDKAVEISTNTVAVRVLQDVTPEVAYEYLIEKFGVDPDHLVVSRTENGREFSDIGYSQMALGGLTDGVSVLDMAEAYAVFPRDGVHVESRTYSRVVDSNGKEILTKDLEGTPVLKESTTYYINEMLENVVNMGTAYGARFSDLPAAGKTGTTNSYYDNWFVGYTPYYTAAVWAGYDSNEPIIATGSPPVRLWKQIMATIHEGLAYKDFTQPSELTPVTYCLDSGLLATDECKCDMRGSRAATGYLLPEDAPTEYCTLHTMVEVCLSDPVLDEEGNPTGVFRLAGEFCPAMDTDSPDTVEPPAMEAPPVGVATADAAAAAALSGRSAVSVLDLQREYLNGVVPEDDMYLLSHLEALGPCTIHTEAEIVDPEPYDPLKFDITDPSTWPTEEEDPNFSPSDPSTWPTTGGPVTSPPPAGESPLPGRPQDTPNPGLTPPPIQSASPTLTPPPDDEDEPLLPPI